MMNARTVARLNDAQPFQRPNGPGSWRIIAFFLTRFDTLAPSIALPVAPPSGFRNIPSESQSL